MNSEDEFDIRQYFGILRRRIWIVVVAVVACAAAAAAVSFMQTKQYTATSKVIISAQQDIAGGGGGALSDPNQLQNQMQTEVQIAESPQTQAIVNEKLGSDANRVTSISAKGVTNTRVMEISVTSPSPSVAQRAADEYSSAYLAVGEQNDVNRVLSIGNTVKAKQDQLRTQINDLNGQIAGAEASRANELRGQVDALQTQINQLQTQYNTTQAAALVRENAAQPLSSAELPSSPSSPQPLRNIALALVLGALIGIGIALIADRVDDRLRNSDQLRDWFPKIPQLGSIPKVEDWTNTAEAKTVTLLDPQSRAAEAYRGLRTSIDFASLSNPMRMICFTSSTAAEGKSTTVANIATALAWAGKSVVIVGGDLRRPRLHQFFGVSNDAGITSVLLGERELPDVLQKVDVPQGSLHVLATGPTPANPAEMLGSHEVSDMFVKLREHADYVLIDAPPVLPVADPLVISRYCDGIVFVAGAEKARKRHLDKAFEVIERGTMTPLVGVVVNGADGELSYSSKYGYYGNGSK